MTRCPGVTEQHVAQLFPIVNLLEYHAFVDRPIVFCPGGKHMPSSRGNPERPVPGHHSWQFMAHGKHTTLRLTSSSCRVRLNVLANYLLSKRYKTGDGVRKELLHSAFVLPLLLFNAAALARVCAIRSLQDAAKARRYGERALSVLRQAAVL